MTSSNGLKSAVSKIIKKLKEKGYSFHRKSRGLKKFVSTPQGLAKIQPPTTKRQHFIRLHAQEFNCQLIYKSPKYDILLKTKNLFYIEGHTIRLYKDSLEVYAGDECEFVAEDEQRATALSIQYWARIFTKLENRLNIILIKGENTKIKQVNAHYAEVGNELAKDYNEHKIKVSIYGLEDGKLWFKIDNSWQLDEAETLHPSQSKHDMARVKQVFNEFRNEMCLTPMEMTVSLNRMARGFELYAENIESHIEAIKQLGEAVKELRGEVRGIKDGIQR